MPEKRFDLFSANNSSLEGHAGPDAKGIDVSPAELDDNALLAAIPVSGLREGSALAAEAGRRGLAEAIPILEGYCHRFSGFGAVRSRGGCTGAGGLGSRARQRSLSRNNLRVRGATSSKGSPLNSIRGQAGALDSRSSTAIATSRDLP